MDKDEKRIYGCWLRGIPGVGNRTIEKLLALCGDERAVYYAGETAWKQVLTAKQLEKMREFSKTADPQRLYQELTRKGIRFVMREDEEYPGRLKRIPDSPYAMYVKGRLPEDNKPSVAVVGARDCSEYGSFVASGIGKLLGSNHIQVISGMARGIDGISQRAALQAGGISFGVLGCGVDVCYPSSNRELYDALCGQGGVLSAYPPGTEARPGNFPPRNRIVSGLSDVLIVVEARARSGTLITVDMALEQGKDVYVVPGRITDRLSDGCNKLVKQGAEVFLSPEEFLQELWERWKCGPVGRVTEWSGPKKCGGDKQHACPSGEQLQWKPTSGVQGLGREYREIYDALDFDPATPEQIRSRIGTQYPLPRLMSLLMGVCAEGLAVQVSPGHFMKKGTGGTENLISFSD